MSKEGKCRVNSDGSVCLSDILSSFNALSIGEEHAWALCYQCAKFFSERLKSGLVPVLSDVGDVYLQTDGNVHERTIRGSDEEVMGERGVVSGLGIVIYRALDQGTENGEERAISNELEQLISYMISEEGPSNELSHHETDDEGIERDSEEHEMKSYRVSLAEVIKKCEDHLTLTKTEAEAHYKAVVRALVAEALELSTFLEKVAQGRINIKEGTGHNRSELDQLQFSDWARFWVQVMGELRTGVKLKKVNYSKAPIEYELTPYEILMKDIRSCRYNLRKIMVNGDVPSRVTKDAHVIILEFIRSRPPLKKVSERKLAPQTRVLTPREQLLNSIRKGRKLRPVPRPRMDLKSNNHAPSSSHSSSTNLVTPTPACRKLLKVDFSQFKDDEDDDDIDYDPPTLDSTLTTSNAIEPGLWSVEQCTEVTDPVLEPYDLATTNNYPRPAVRRHTLGVVDPNLGCHSVPQSRPCSRQSCNSSEAELEPEVARQIQDELTGMRSWQDAISLDDRLSLTLQEIVHIRAVLTKAELEALPVEGRVRHDVEMRKVCFLCLKTRFGIFGPWGQRCTLCKRTVCSKCCSKMNIPMEHFASVPVVLLSPSIMATPEEEHRHLVKTPDSLGAASPDNTRPNSAMESSIISDPGTVSGSNLSARFRSKASAVGRAQRVVDRFKASQMMVCHDCRMMVLQIIKSARVNRSAIRNKTLQSLTLNLSPVFTS